MYRNLQPREVVTSFLGQFTHTIDEKGRVSLPAKFREGAPGGEFVATRGVGPCLFLYLRTEWDRVLERLERQKARLDPDQRRYYLQLMQHTAEATVDGQGRISLPQSLVQLAGIEKEMTFVGAGDVIEIWNPVQYEQYVGGPDQDFESWMSNFL